MTQPARPAGTADASPAAPAAPVRRRWHQLPLLAVVVLLAAGLVGVSLNHWRKGAMVMGAAPLLAALLRGLLPAREIGMLTIRGRGFDVVLLTCVGVAVIALAWVVPVYYHAR